MEKTIALIVGAGRGRRFGGDIPKQYCALGGTPILTQTLGVFLNHPRIDGIACVINPDDLALYNLATEGLDLLDWVAGGERRQDSVRLGLEAIQAQVPGIARVLVHDAARPFATANLIDRVLKALDTAAGAIPALAMTDTVKQATPDRLIEHTIPRGNLWRVQTPQGFHFQPLIDAHRQLADADELTDDAALFEQLGLDCTVVDGDDGNIKITTKADLDLANHRQGAAIMETRMGLGYDVHRLIPGDKITLCGIDIPHRFTLQGHSDADVAMHTVTDAILGAIAEGDIGSHFPPTDPQWKGAASHIFLEKARDLVAEKRGKIINIDVTIICEAPKIGPHRDAMRARLADFLAISVARVAVKATTTEKLGFTGRGEGIAAQAIATVALPAAD